MPDEIRRISTSGKSCVPARLVGVYLMNGLHSVGQVHFVLYRGPTRTKIAPRAVLVLVRE